MTHRPTLRLSIAATLISGAVACSSSDTTPEPGPDGGTTGVTLEGVVMDYFLQEPLAGAAMFVDTGTEVLTGESGADGTFAIDGVPADEPVTVTALAEGRWAQSFAGVTPSELTAPLGFVLLATDYALYQPTQMTVHANVTGALADDYLFVYGGNDQGGNSFMQVPSADPFTIHFVADVYPNQTDVTFTFASLDPSNAEVHALGHETLDVQSEVTVDVTIESTPATTLELQLNRPSLDGAPFADPDPDYTHIVGITHLLEAFNDPMGSMALTGFSTTAEWSGDDLNVGIPRVVVPGFHESVRVVLSEDFEAPAAPTAFANVPVDDGNQPMVVELLDSPTVADKADFEPGATISWEPVAGADDYNFMVIADDQPVWWIITHDTEVTFPAFPADFDQSRLPVAGGWIVRARKASFDWYSTDFIAGPDDYVYVSVTTGGTASW